MWITLSLVRPDSRHNIAAGDDLKVQVQSISVIYGDNGAGPLWYIHHNKYF